MYQDIKCAFVYKSSEETKNKEDDTTFAANQPTQIAHDINSNNEDSANYNKLNASASSFEPSLHLESYRVFSSQSVQVDGALPSVGMSL